MHALLKVFVQPHVLLNNGAEEERQDGGGRDREGTRVHEYSTTTHEHVCMHRHIPNSHAHCPGGTKGAAEDSALAKNAHLKSSLQRPQSKSSRYLVECAECHSIAGALRVADMMLRGVRCLPGVWSGMKGGMWV